MTPRSPNRPVCSSNVPWIQHLPLGWQVAPMFTVVIERSTTNAGMVEDNLLSLSYGKIVKKDITSSEGLLPESFETYQIVERGDIVFRLTDLQNDQRSLRTALVPMRGIITSAYVTVKPKGIRAEYLAYLLRSYDVQKVFYSMGGGMRQTMKFEDLRRLPVLLPDDAQQEVIVAYLDREIACIDALIEKKTCFIALLREKRQALITQAVTRGLDPRVPMKDSGVEWVGQVPAHWETKPFKYCVRYQEGPGIMAADFQDEGVPLLRISCVQGKWATLDGCNYLAQEKVERQWRHFKLTLGDLLISGSASMGVVSEVGDEVTGAVAYTGLIRLRGMQGRMTKEYLRWLVVSDVFLTQMDLLKAGSTIQHFGPTHLDQMLICCPPTPEQRVIAGYVDEETLRIESVISATEKSIVLLAERRSALITAAVTGQIDVCAEQPVVEAPEFA